MNDRLFPARPILAVSAAVFREGRVLIVRRARAPLLGHFSLPGGVVEVGETMAAALARELMEEVSVEAEIIAFNRHVGGDRPRGGPGSRAFRHRLVRRPLDEGRATLERRSRRRRLDRSRRRLTVADDAGIERGSGERGADRRSDRYRRKMTVDLNRRRERADSAPSRCRDAIARMRKSWSLPGQHAPQRAHARAAPRGKTIVN